MKKDSTMIKCGICGKKHKAEDFFTLEGKLYVGKDSEILSGTKEEPMNMCFLCLINFLRSIQVYLTCAQSDKEKD